MAVRDIIIGSVILFSFALIFFVIYFVSNTITTTLVEIPQLNQSEEFVNVMHGMDEKVNNRIDYLFFGLFVGLAIALIVTGWLVGGITIFAIVYVLLIVLTVIFSAIFSYVWQEVTPASVFGVAVSAFPITNHIMVWLPLYMAVLGFIGVIVMFAKPSNE